MKTRQSVYDVDQGALVWYSRAVGEMKKRDISDPTSWWYQAAVHGYSNSNPFWRNATGYPPSTALQNSGYWNRCQHGTWYFLPWHRMYLYYFEETVAKAVVELGGPAGWTLPYWNYCDYLNTSASQQERQQALSIPPAFGTSAGPDSDSPELWIAGRRNYVLNPRNVNPWPALQETEFTNSAGGDRVWWRGHRFFTLWK